MTTCDLCNHDAHRCQDCGQPVTCTGGAVCEECVAKFLAKWQALLGDKR